MHLDATRTATQGGDAYDLRGMQRELNVSSVSI
jgi:hypothetical protein